MMVLGVVTPFSLWELVRVEVWLVGSWQSKIENMIDSWVAIQLGFVLPNMWCPPFCLMMTQALVIYIVRSSFNIPLVFSPVSSARRSRCRREPGWESWSVRSVE